MKNWLYRAIVSICVLSLSTATHAEKNNSTSNIEKESTEYITSIYRKINFCMDGKLNFEVFEKAYRGYLSLKNAGQLSNDKEIISICDFSLSANVNRLWVIDLQHNKILFNTYVAHGQGSGEEFATAFSNTENSHQSSIGFYVTDETYIGEHGLSLRLKGLDNQYNSAAFDRGIVLHGADYVSENFIAGNQRLGRSWGCPAVATELAPNIINTIKNGSCLFIYYPDKRYLASSFWLNKRLNKMSEKMSAHKFELQVPTQPEGDEVRQLVNKK
jgi:hypothetical protein